MEDRNTKTRHITKSVYFSDRELIVELVHQPYLLEELFSKGEVKMQAIPYRKIAPVDSNLLYIPVETTKSLRRRKPKTTTTQGPILEQVPISQPAIYNYQDEIIPKQYEQIKITDDRTDKKIKNAMKEMGKKNHQRYFFLESTKKFKTNQAEAINYIVNVKKFAEKYDYETLGKTYVEVVLQKFKSHVFNHIKPYINSKQGVKINLAATCHYLKEGEEGRYLEFWAYEKPPIITNASDFTNTYAKVFDKISNLIFNIDTNPSGLIFKGIERITLHISKFSYPTGCSYLKLPFTSKFITNIKVDNYCASFSLAAGLMRLEGITFEHIHKERPFYYKKKVEELNLEGISFPTPLHQITNLEKITIVQLKYMNFKNQIEFILHTKYIVHLRKRYTILICYF